LKIAPQLGADEREMSVNGESLRVCTKRAMQLRAVGNSRASAI